MRPRKRYLKGNAGTEGPTSLLFFDSESWMKKTGPTHERTEGTLRLWVAQYVRRDGDRWRPPVTHRGHTAAEFWALVERLSSWRRPLWAFGHNLAWDLTQLDFWSELEKWRWTAGPVEREPNPDTGKPRAPWRGRLALASRPTFLVVRGSRGILKLVDTLNYWPTALSKIGDKLGVPKLPAPDFNGPEPPLWPYCERDVAVTRLAVIDLMDRWRAENCGVFQLTAPMLAMRNFQHTCHAKVPGRDAINIVLEDDSPARPLERASFLGGRIEPFYLGQLNGPIYHLDLTSLYPAVMKDELYPRCRKKCVTGIRPDRLRDFLYAFGGIARVKINTGPDADTYPVRRDGVQLHACGVFETVLCGPELRRALDHGHVELVGECHLYSVCDLFSQWAARWLDVKATARRQGDRGQEEFAKLILVSLAGKFAQRGDHWTDDPTRAPRKGWGRVYRKDCSSGTIMEWRYVAGHTQRRDREGEPGNAFPAISAFVTSNARERMRAIFGLMPARSLLYTATDSIICTRAGFDALTNHGLIDQEEAGKLRVIDVHASAEICGPNWYRLDERWVRSGLWGKARQLADGRWVCDVWDQMGVLTQAHPHGRCGFTTVELSRVFASEKNSPGESGWRVPMRLSPDESFSDRPRVPRSRFAREQ